MLTLIGSRVLTSRSYLAGGAEMDELAGLAFDTNVATAFVEPEEISEDIIPGLEHEGVTLAKPKAVSLDSVDGEYHGDGPTHNGRNPRNRNLCWPRGTGRRRRLIDESKPHPTAGKE